MLMLISLTYCGLIWLVFFKFKLLPWNPKSRMASILAGVALILGIVILLGQGSPQSVGGVGITTRTVNLQAYSTGRVTKVHVPTYQPMKKGDPIVEVDPVPYQITVRQREAALASAINGVKQMQATLDGAKANVAVVQANIRTAGSAVEAASANVQAAEAALAAAREMHRSGEAEVTRHESNVKTAALQIPRIRKLVAEAVAPQSDLDNAENHVVAAKAGLTAAQAMEKKYTEDVKGKEASVQGAKASEEQARRNLDSLQAQLLAAQASERKARLALDATVDGEHVNIREARAQLATAKYNLSQTVIYAPKDGFVAALAVTEGDMLKFGQFGTFVLTGESFLLATFKQTTAKHIKPGQKAEISFRSRPGEIFEAEVLAVVWASGEAQLSQSGNLPLVDQLVPAKNVGVRFKLKDVEGFTPGMGKSGSVAIYTDHAQAFAIIRKIMLRVDALLNYVR